MGRNTLRQQQKRKDRERRIREEKIDDARHRLEEERSREYTRTYPELVLEANNADPAFVELIRGALSRLSLEDRAVFAAWESYFYRQVKTEGADRAFSELTDAIPRLVEQGNEMARLAEVSLVLHLGQAVFDRVPRGELNRYLLFNDVTFVPFGRRIRVIFKALLSAKGRRGTAYYSPRRPTIEVNGEPKVVAFSFHAMERICERIDPQWDTYAGHGDVFGFFESCVYFEKCVLHRGQVGFTFYEQCDDDRFWNHFYFVDVLGTQDVQPAAGPCYYRVGYCPAVVDGDFIIAKTFLFPGYNSTPEYGAILKHAGSAERRQRLRENVWNLTATRLQQAQDLGIIKWFHDHGIPQVVQIQGPVFVP